MAGEIMFWQRRQEALLRSAGHSTTMKTCECERQPIAYYVTLTKADGELLDRAGMCGLCIEETAAKRALSVLGIQKGAAR